MAPVFSDSPGVIESVSEEKMNLYVYGMEVHTGGNSAPRVHRLSFG